jgi:DNA polymerase III epsilon subunit family exonuclease
VSKQLLQHSIFYEVLFPAVAVNPADQERFSLLRCIAFEPLQGTLLAASPIVVFDLETTGLSPEHDQIIEIGAQKIVEGAVVAEFSTLISCPRKLSRAVAQLTGISDQMLVGQPELEGVIEDFLTFIDGCILVAHNASFDMGFIRATCKRFGIELTWPVMCTLKLARELLPDLARKNLDTLAEHFGLDFEARHRSIGDVKVTAAVLSEMLAEEGKHLRSWQDFAPFTV